MCIRDSLYNFQVIFCCLQFLACLLHAYFPFFVLFSADKLVVVQFLGTGEIRFGLGSVDFRQSYAAFGRVQLSQFCLLYTSDAADEEDSGDLGGIQIIKKKKIEKINRKKKKTRQQTRR